MSSFFFLRVIDSQKRVSSEEGREEKRREKRREKKRREKKREKKRREEKRKKRIHFLDRINCDAEGRVNLRHWGPY